MKIVNYIGLQETAAIKYVSHNDIYNFNYDGFLSNVDRLFEGGYYLAFSWSSFSKGVIYMLWR